MRSSEAEVRRAIKTREIINLAADGACVRGTYHPPQPTVTASEADEGPRIGIVFPNSGVLPRAATGDSAVYWADCFARAGYRTFRLDFEGLGDSGGDIPKTLLDFLSCVHAGRYVSSFSAAIKVIVHRFKLSGVVIVAHCAGTISGLYTAAASNDVKGVVLLDPYFHLPEFNPHNGSTSNRDTGLPSNANLRLIDCWNQVASERIPILVLTATSLRANTHEFDYLSYLRTASVQSQRITVEPIEGTPHSFAEGPGKEAVRRHIEAWLGNYFSRQQV
jgi:pimeloyl-ACP methyl ester carboxylesterase